MILPLQPTALEYSVSMKKHWANPNHQNSCTNEKDCWYLGSYVLFLSQSGFVAHTNSRVT